MSFDWNNYLAIAEKIKKSTDRKSENGNNEALRRTAISRAYYAVYHIAEDYAKTNFDYMPAATGHNQHHSDVRAEFLRQMGNPDHQEVGKILFRLNKDRKKCDYDANGLGNIEITLSSTITEANKIKSVLV